MTGPELAPGIDLSAQIEMAPALAPASRRAIAYYRRQADIHHTQAELDRSRDSRDTAAHHDRLADLWTALADELEAFGATCDPHPDQGALL